MNHKRLPPRCIPNTNLFAAASLLAAGFAPMDARASLLSGDALDAAADVVAWVALILVPIIGIVVFWMVHVLPEKIAHKRHHPQTKAIQTLCLLSLVFGGLLWPVAWLWAYTRPVAYKLAYGTDRGDEYFHEYAAKARAGELPEEELAQLRNELEFLHRRGLLTGDLAALRDELNASGSAVGRETTPELAAKVRAEGSDAARESPELGRRRA